jgi:cell division protein FtsI (penicillin-binding protein 3)/stage V sporulation protein D (sporulation-specific penicillin-binding protein)
MRAQFRTRIRIIIGLFALITCIVVFRLLFVQLVHGEEYAARADRQFMAQSGGLFDRGSIYFTRKDGGLISAAALATGFVVAINPQLLTDPERAYTRIASAASSTLSRDAFFAAASQKNRVYIEVAHHLRTEAGEALSREAIPGVQVLKESWRYYPGGSLASQSIGIVAYGSGDTLVGQTGIETIYDGTLSRSGDALYHNFFAELFSNVGNLLIDARDVREGDILTTIEPEVQTRLEYDLARVHERYGSRETGGIIMNPKTGEIIALATAPTYDNNDLAHADPTLLGNPLVEHVYEFGSTMKTATMAAGLDAGVITPTSTYHDTDCITVDTKKICNWDLKGHGTVSMNQIIIQSLNIGAAWVATQLGQERFRSYFTALFGSKTNIDLPNEAHALLGNLSKPQQIGYDTAAYGQGIAVTPLQMIRALGTLANDGVMVEPHLVRGIRLSSGLVRPTTTGSSTRIFESAAVREVATMMTELVDTKLSNGKASIPTLSVAGKTGTAQLTDGKGGYATDRYFHSFFGFFPSYAPRFVILLYTNDPKSIQYASETLTETFLDTVHFLNDYYEVPPDRGVTTRSSEPHAV